MTLSRRSKRTILALFVLVVPSICYMLLRTGTNYYHSLPVYGPDGASLFSEDFSDSAWHQIDFSRLSGDGLPEIGVHAPTGNRNKIYVAGFFRENVNASAETLAVNMIRVAKTYKDMERLEFITFIATDSASSSVTSLEKLLEHYGANPEKWKPVRLPVAEAAEVARRMFFLQIGRAHV